MNFSDDVIPMNPVLEAQALLQEFLDILDFVLLSW